MKIKNLSHKGSYKCNTIGSLRGRRKDDSRRARGEGLGGGAHKACKDAMGIFRFSHLPTRCKNNDYLN